MLVFMATTNKSSRANTVVAYVRVSTEEQANEGVSLAAQEERIRAYCQLRGLELVAVVVDAGVSAGKPLASREGGARVLELVRRKQAGAVVALKLDRLFRNAADCLSTVEGWDRAGVALHLVDIGGASVDTSSAMGRFFLTVMAGAAEMERNQIRERTSLALQHKAAQHELVGSVPYGFRLADDGRTLLEHEGEQEVIRIARELRATGMSLRAIGAELEARGLRTRKGTAWAAPQVQRMVA